MVPSSAHSISSKLAKLSVGIALTLGLILSLIQITIDFVQQEQALDSIVDQIFLVASAPASQAVFNLDKKFAQDLTDGLLEYAFIVEAEILDENGNRLASSQVTGKHDRQLGQILNWITPHFSTYTRPLSWAASSEYSDQGMLIIKIDQYIALEDYFNRSLFVVIAGVVRNLLLALILVWLFRRLLGRPLQQLVDDLQKMDSQHPDKKRITIDKQHQHNELGILAENINQYADANDGFLSQLVEAEQAARTAEELYRDVAESAADWYWEMDSELRFINISERYCEISGFSLDDVVGETRHDLIIPDEFNSIEKIQAHLSLIEAHKPFRDYEYLMLTKSSQPIPIRISGKPLFDTEGNFLGYRGIGVDLTEELNIKRAQAQRDSMLSEAARIAKLGYAIRSGDELEIESVSNEYAAIFGYSSAQFIKQFRSQKQLLKLIHEDDREYYIATHTSPGKYDSRHRLEYRILHKDEQFRHIIEWSRKVEDGDDRVESQLQIVVTIQDVTEIKQIEQKLIETEQRFRHLYEGSMAAMATISTAPENDSSVIFCNQAFATLFGYENPAEVCKHCKTKDTWYDPGLRSTLMQKLEEQGEMYAEIKAKRKDGTVFWISAAEKTLPQQELVESVIIDITERKKIEADLKEQQLHLESLVQERTAELQRINEEQKSFSYSVSHDLRQPLRAINGFSEALLEDYYDSLDETGRDYLNRVCKASVRMGELIDSLLKLSRLSRQEMIIETVSLTTIAEELLTDLTVVDPHRSVEINIHQDLEVEGDRGLVKVALMNLLSNAWKFTRDCDPAKIELGVNVENGVKVFFIRDNGTGFDMTYADKLFGEFQRLHDARGYEGIGIGLATVRRIFVRHGGKIWAESTPGKGATFFFTLG